MWVSEDQYMMNINHVVHRDVSLLSYHWFWKVALSRKSDHEVTFTPFSNGWERMDVTLQMKICQLCSFSDSTYNFLGQSEACLHTFNRHKLATPNDSGKQEASFKD